MESTVSVIYGTGFGKTSAAIGKAVYAVAEGKSVEVVQFLKGSADQLTVDAFKRLEPEMKVFRFERFSEKFSDLDEESKAEELINIRNGINFVRKIITTNGCDLLVLDEILGLVDQGIVTADEIVELIKSRPEEMSVILTGVTLDPAIRAIADTVSYIVNE